MGQEDDKTDEHADAGGIGGDDCISVKRYAPLGFGIMFLQRGDDLGTAQKRIRLRLLT